MPYETPQVKRRREQEEYNARRNRWSTEGTVYTRGRGKGMGMTPTEEKLMTIVRKKRKTVIYRSKPEAK